MVTRSQWNIQSGSVGSPRDGVTWCLGPWAGGPHCKGRYQWEFYNPYISRVRTLSTPMYFRPFIWEFMTIIYKQVCSLRNLTGKTSQLQTGMCYFSGSGGEGQPLFGGELGDAIYMFFYRKCDVQEILIQRPNDPNFFIYPFKIVETNLKPTCHNDVTVKQLIFRSRQVLFNSFVMNFSDFNPTLKPPLFGWLSWICSQGLGICTFSRFSNKSHKLCFLFVAWFLCRC